MKKLLLLLALLTTILSSSRAEVLIYKGPSSVRVPPGSPIPTKIEIFILFDLAAKKFASVAFFKFGGEKKQIPGAPSDIDITTAPILGGGNARIAAGGSVSSTAPDFNRSILYFRGTQKSIVVKDAGGPITRNEPRFFSGTVLTASESSGNGNFGELRIRLAFDKAETVNANNNGLTIQQAFDAISADLLAKGYALP